MKQVQETRRFVICKKGVAHMKISTPEAQGISSKTLERFIQRLQEQNLPIHSVLIARHGYLVMEAYYQPYDKDKLHRMFSETKSFISLAIGLLATDGVIGLDDRICSYFPEYLPGKVHPWLEEMTIRDMLRMETCYNKTTYNKYSITENWVRSFFQTEPAHRPGRIFVYDTSASHTLGALVEKLTGQKVLDFLKDRVLRQIGFSEESYIMEDPFGVSMGGSGLMAKPMDMLKTGLMLLNGGKHPDDYGKEDGRQLYPKEYLDQAFQFQTPTVMGSLSDWGYGYQFWKMPGDGFAMLGMGSQNTMCFPEQDMVFTVASDTQDIPNGSDMILDLIQTEIFVSLSDLPFPELDEGGQKRWKAMLLGLRLPSVQDWGGKNKAELVSGSDYKFYVNQNGFSRMRLTFMGELEGILEYENERGIHQILFGMGENRISRFPEYNQLCAASGAWCREDTFYLLIQLIDESVGAVHFKFVFSEDGTMTVLMRKTEESKFNEFQGICTAIG